MAWCCKCGIPSEKSKLFNAISNKGIVLICKKCADEESLPIMDRSANKKPEEPKPEPTVRQRLTKMSGFERRTPIARPELRQQEASLRQLVEKNFKDQPEKIRIRTDLIENFHWAIMRTRRRKKVTQKQMAEEIQEPETAIINAEKGFINDDRIIRKIENYLEIRIMKQEKFSNPSNRFETERSKILNQAKTEGLKIEPETAKVITISDLQDIKKQKEKSIFGLKKKTPKPEEEPEFIDLDEDEKEPPKKDLTKSEIDDILFGRK